MEYSSKAEVQMTIDRSHRHAEPLDIAEIVRGICGCPAQNYFRTHIAPPLANAVSSLRTSQSAEDLKSSLLDPEECLAIIVGVYAFYKNFKDRRGPGHSAVSFLRSCLTADSDFIASGSLEDLWISDERLAASEARPCMSEPNRAILGGLFLLSQRCWRREGCSLGGYIQNFARNFHRIEPIFEELVSIRGLGPKLASVILRDFIYVLGAESTVANRDSIYCQPIDRWARRTAPMLIADPDSDSMPDWVLAGKFAKLARSLGQSPIALNFGIADIGIQAARWHDPEVAFNRLTHQICRDAKRVASLPAAHLA